MNSKLKKGLFAGLTIYGIGFLISFLYYIYVPQQDHMPAIYMLVLIGLFYLSCILLFLNIFLLLFKKIRVLAIGIIITNIIYILMCLIYLYFKPN
ncbi:hypothetical protein [Kordia jejudonensis]|uniref:hypothetical protein n=1 Tax=Kordia jejudonensis TaxID=1348245 RepID=UPI0012E04425|nr:hypothetical protein [Kordia jejudonensis]